MMNNELRNNFHQKIGVVLFDMIVEPIAIIIILLAITVKYYHYLQIIHLKSTEITATSNCEVQHSPASKNH